MRRRRVKAHVAKAPAAASGDTMTALPLPAEVGLGLRAAFADELVAGASTRASFLEIAPENYLRAGGARRRLLDAARDRFPIAVHGLCGDLAGSAPLDDDLVADLHSFLRLVGAPFFSDHLCWTSLGGVEVHELLPLPHCEQAAMRAAARIRTLRDRLELPVAIEPVSALFRTPGGTMSESDFLNMVLAEADCALLLDVNNVWVNAQNFNFDPRQFIDSLPLARVVEIHVAGGEWDDQAGCMIDTHGADTPEDVLSLLEYALMRLGRGVPILVERDHNIPPLHSLEAELARVAAVVQRCRTPQRSAEDRAR